MIPRSRSMEFVSRKASPWSTLPALRIAPVRWRIASESVVFPASTWARRPMHKYSFLFSYLFLSVINRTPGSYFHFYQAVCTFPGGRSVFQTVCLRVPCRSSFPGRAACFFIITKNTSSVKNPKPLKLWQLNEAETEAEAGTETETKVHTQQQVACLIT